MDIGVKTKYNIGDKVYVRPFDFRPDDIRLGEVEYLELYADNERITVSYRVNQGWEGMMYPEEEVFETKDECRLHYAR